MRCFALLLVLLLAVALPADVFGTDLVIEKELLTEGTVAVGDTVRFKITVRNDKITNAIPSDVELYERFSAALRWVNLEGDFDLSDCVSVDTGDAATGGFDCAFFIEAQEVKMATVTFVAEEVGQWVNGVSAIPLVGDLDGSDNEAQASVVVIGSLRVTKRGEAVVRNPETGIFELAGTSDISYGIYQYIIDVSSTLDNSLLGLSLLDELPDALGAIPLEVVLFVQGARVDCSTENKSYTCGPFDLNPGDEAEMKISFIASPPTLSAEVCNTVRLFQGDGELEQATTCAPVVRRGVSRNEAIEATSEMATPNATVRTSEEPIPAGSQVCDAAGDTCMEMEEPVWISLIDPDPNALYGHETTWATVPAGTDQEGTPPATTYLSGPLPPVINISNEDGTTTTMSATDLPVVINPAPAVESFPDLEIDNTTPPTTPRVCALLVTGFYQNENERTGFQATRSVMQGYLTRQPRGPRIPDAAVETLDNPTAAELEAKLMEFQGICDVLYFYYYGHGDASGLFLKSENNPARYTRLTYPMLAEDIYSVGAIDNTVVLDNCNSGAALPAFRSDPNYSRTNLTLLTGASADNLAYQAIRVNNTLLSFYTGGLAICANDPRADTDGVPGVTLKEAHTWLRRVNPRLLQFRNQMGGIDRFGIIEKQDPQLLENRVQPNDGQSAFFFEEAGVTVMVGSGGKQAGTSAIEAIRVEEVVPRGGVVPNDDDLLELSSGRHRTVEVLETGDPGFVIDIAFTMDAVLDSLTTTELPGLAFRTDDTGTWVPQVATVWDPADSTVTMTGVTTSGDWAFALTTGASSVSVEDAELPLTVALHGNYPNPFNPQTVIGYELPQAVRVRLAVYDVLGREVALLVDAPQAAGQYQAVFEASGLPSGVYVYHLTAGATTQTQQMVLVR